LRIHQGLLITSVYRIGPGNCQWKSMRLETVPGATGHEYEVPGAGREDAVAGKEL
jgi:hypothetical protein